jgi:hypothetical protein
LLDSAAEPAQRGDRGDRHDDGHAIENVAGGGGEVGADERRDSGDVAVAALQCRPAGAQAGPVPAGAHVCLGRLRAWRRRLSAG